jgi:hypothetical protein
MSAKANQPSTNGLTQCALCERFVRKTSRHHLVPKSLGGREMVDLCAACHSTLHHFFRNQTLAKELHTIESLQQNEEIARYLKWVRKQPDSKIQVRESRQKR